MFLPQDFVNRTKILLGDEFSEFEDALENTAPTTIRVNDKMVYQASDDKVTWCENAYYLAERPLFTADPFIHAGVYYVQEASSMFLYQAIKQHFGNAQTVLDLCAAPGGKSTLISQSLSESALLVSNEIIRSRAYILVENLIKWGNPNVVVTNNEPKDFDCLPNFFDAMVIDAPCSGEGMFRKDAGAIKEWSEYNVKLCSTRQREIVTAVWDSLKTDGILVYSTCTFNREENDENVEWICNELGAEIVKLDLNGNQDISVTEYGYRFYPHKTRGEGFFLSVMRKKSISQRSIKLKNDNKISNQFINKPYAPFISLVNPNRWVILQEEQEIKAYDKNRLNDFLLLKKFLKCMHSGILMGELKGNDFIPSTCVALSKYLDRNSVDVVDVDYNTAICYLSKETIKLSETTRAYFLISYKGQTLGWVKNLGNRCNNMYPQEWRIRMKISLETPAEKF